MSISEIVSDIKGIQVVLKKVVQANNLKIDSNLGKYDKKKIIDMDKVEDSVSGEESDDFSKLNVKESSGVNY